MKFCWKCFKIFLIFFLIFWIFLNIFWEFLEKFFWKSVPPEKKSWLRPWPCSAPTFSAESLLSVTVWGLPDNFEKKAKRKKIIYEKIAKICNRPRTTLSDRIFQIIFDQFEIFQNILIFAIFQNNFHKYLEIFSLDIDKLLYSLFFV